MAFRLKFVVVDINFVWIAVEDSFLFFFFFKIFFFEQLFKIVVLVVKDIVVEEDEDSCSLTCQPFPISYFILFYFLI